MREEKPLTSNEAEKKMYLKILDSKAKILLPEESETKKDGKKSEENTIEKGIYFANILDNMSNIAIEGQFLTNIKNGSDTGGMRDKSLWEDMKNINSWGKKMGSRVRNGIKDTAKSLKEKFLGS